MYYKILFEKDFSRLDNFTDSLILNTALDKSRENEDSVLQRAMKNARYFESGDQLDNLNKITLDVSKTANVNYERYWVGSMILYRPLLLIMNLQQIRYLLSVIVFILYMLSIYYVMKKIGLRYAFAYAISMFFTQIYINSISLQFFPITMLTLISTILICKLSDKEKFGILLPYILFVVGSLSCFIDILTYPLLTLGISLILIVLIKIKKENNSFKEIIWLIIKYSAIWGIAYGLTFISKWILSSIILNKNIVKIAIEQFTYRTSLTISGTENEITTSAMLLRNFFTYFNKVVIIMLIFSIIYWIVQIVNNKKNNIKISYNKRYIIIFAIIAIMPYLWMLILSNHSYIHFWMVNKIQAITLFAILSILIYTTERNSE